MHLNEWRGNMSQGLSSIHQFEWLGITVDAPAHGDTIACQTRPNSHRGALGDWTIFEGEGLESM